MKVDQTVLVEVIDHFDLAYPVTLCWGNLAPCVYGTYKSLWNENSINHALPSLNCREFYGNHGWPSHFIILDKKGGVPLATESLLHELTHANQLERAIPDPTLILTHQEAFAVAHKANAEFIKEYERYGVTANQTESPLDNGYWTHPMEIEAREVSERLAKQLKKPVFK